MDDQFIYIKLMSFRNHFPSLNNYPYFLILDVFHFNFLMIAMNFNFIVSSF